MSRHFTKWCTKQYIRFTKNAKVQLNIFKCSTQSDWKSNWC